MNNKISKIQLGMILSLLICSMHLGLGDIILLDKANNKVLISMIIGTLIGFIPIIMYLKINSILENKNIYEKNIKLFGKKIGFIFNIIIFIIHFFMLIISIKSIVIFITSKYLQDTPFLVSGLLVIITIIIISFCNIEGIARTLQICFILSIIFMITVEILLINYININNVFPIFTGNKIIKEITCGALYFASQTSILSFLLLTINKDKINNKKNFNKTIVFFYLFGCIALTFSMYFVVSSFGYNMALMFRYPEYIILKKITLANTDLHLENLLAFRWNFYMLTLGVISLYGIINLIKTYSNNRKINKRLILIISFLSVVISKYLFGTIIDGIIFMKKYYVKYIASSIFILFLIVFIRCLFVKKHSK